MSRTPSAFLLHGFLGAGKTTLAKRLEQEHNAVRFTHDEWMSRLYGSDPPVKHFQDNARRVFEVMEGVWTRCLDLGTNVVLDFGLWSRSERAHIRALISAHGGESVLYRLNCPTTSHGRGSCSAMINWPGAYTSRPSPIQSLKSRFEPLGSDEPCVEIDA